MTELKPKEAAVMHGLSLRPELNGQTATLLRYDTELRRWRLRLRDGKCVALRTENIRAVAAAPARTPAAEPSSESESESDDDVACRECGMRHSYDGNQILLCDGTCGHGFHQLCLPTVLAEVPDGDWLCHLCMASSEKAANKKRTAAKRANAAATATAASAGAEPSTTAAGSLSKRRRRAPTQQGAASKPPPKRNLAGSSQTASDAWEAALDALQPRSDDEIEAAAPSTAAASAPPARDPRLQGFRIGGQAETAEERGEWCGPWSTARGLLERRAAALAERIAELGGQAPPPLVEWQPSRDTTISCRPGHSSVPSLQALVVGFLAENIDAVESFGVLATAQQHAIAAELSRRRAFRDPQLALLLPPGARLAEVVVPDCSLVSEEALLESLGPLAAGPLSLLSLGFCGRCFPSEALARLEETESLASLELTGCYQLSDEALVSFLRARGEGLTSLRLNGNNQVGAPTLEAIGKHCASLDSLRLEDFAHLQPSDVLHLDGCSSLRALSLRGLLLLDDASLLELLAHCCHTLEELCIANCALITPAAIGALASLCSKLRILDLSGVELLDDDTASQLGRALPQLAHLSLRRCVQLSDTSVEAIAAARGRGLRTLSLNNVPAIGDASLVALRAHCAPSLEQLDLSWCRSVTDSALGSLVDSAKQLETLTLWGCSQLTNAFYNGHTNDSLRIVGRFNHTITISEA